MLSKYFFAFIVILGFSPIGGYAQRLNDVKKNIQERYQQALLYKDVSLYGECIGELEQVIKLANNYGLRKEMINACITKAEVFRITQNFDRGTQLLYQLENTEEFPKLHVRKLGRLAALYAENGQLDEQLASDSVTILTNQGLEIAVRLGLKEEEASLRNEIGFSQGRQKQFKAGLKNLNRI